MAFTGHALQIHYQLDSLLLKKHVPKKMLILERDCLEHHGEMLLFKMAHVSLLFFLTRGGEIMNAPGSDKDNYLTRWNKSTDTDSCHL